MDTILFISQKRNDAIGIVDSAQKLELSTTPHNFEFFEIERKGSTKSEIIKNYCKNFFSLFWKTRKYKQLYFSWENPYVWLLRLFFYRGKITMCVHHLESWAQSWIGKKILSSCNSFVTISEFTKKQLIEAGVSEEKIFVNYNGISNSFYPEKIENFFKKKYILYVGTELPRKNLQNLIRAFSIFQRTYPNIAFVKIGDPGSEEAKQEFDNFLQAFPYLRPKIFLKRENMNPDELRKWYSNAEFYISVSMLEGFGMTIPEAMACSCPIIASNIGAFEEICQDKKMLVDPKNPEKIAQKMLQLIENSAIRNDNIATGKRRTKVFSWKENINRLISLFQK